MSPTRQFNGVRLAVAGVASMLLLIWLTILGPNLGDIPWLPPEFFTTLFSIIILVILLPVAFHGSWPDRLLALLLMAFPVLTLVAIWFVLPHVRFSS